MSSDIQKKPLHFKKSLVIHAKVCLSTRDSVVHGYSCFSGRPGSLMSPACPSSVYLTPGSVLRGHGLPLFHEHKAAMTTCSCRINPFFRLSAALIQKLKGQIIPTGYTCAQLRRLVLLVSLVTSRLYMLKKKKNTIWCSCRLDWSPPVGNSTGYDLDWTQTQSFTLATTWLQYTPAYPKKIHISFFRMHSLKVRMPSAMP